MKKILVVLFGWTPKRLVRWGEVRAKGATRFIILRGIGWGFVQFISMVIGYYIQGDNPSPFFSSPKAVLLCFAIFYPAGLLASLFEWQNVEASYLKAHKEGFKPITDDNGNTAKA